MKNLAPPQWGLLYMAILIIMGTIGMNARTMLNQPVKVSVLNVGQGDAILIQTPEHKNILIDAGPDGSLVYELDKKLNFFNRKIDLFILTHPHRDHFMGALDALEKYPFKKIMLTGVASQDPLYINWIQDLKAKSIPLIFPHHAQDWQIGKELVLDVLYPFENQSLLGQEMKNKNNASIVILLKKTDGTPLMLLAGDAEKEQEREILLSGQNLNSPLIKIGHHGSRTSTTPLFLEAIKPHMAVVSAGAENRFKHPHPETLKSMEERGIKVYRTDLNGGVTFTFK